MLKIFALCLLAVAVYGAPRYPTHSYGYAPAPVKVVKVEKVEKVTEKPHARPHGYGYAPRPAPVKVVKVEKVEKVIEKPHARTYGYGYAPSVKVEEKPRPYDFSYEVKDEYHNSHSRQETGDEHGNMEGSYGITLADGRTRWVQYWADENGFRAKIDTNEPGTDAQNPADVEMNANPIEIKEQPKKVHGYGYAPVKVVKVEKVEKVTEKPHARTHGYGYAPRSYHY